MLRCWSDYIHKYEELPRAKSQVSWENLSLWELSKEEIAELNISTKKQGILREAIQEVLCEWRTLGFRWQPYFWLSSEWFYPEGSFGVAVPLFLAHPHLLATEEFLFGNVEGKDKEEIKKYIRHELGHLVDYQFAWRYKRQRQVLFGKSSERYPKKYYVKPDTKKFVKNLPAYYSQSHPDEDLAETFAIYMDPKSNWKKKYSKGMIRKKLDFIDEQIQLAPKNKPKDFCHYSPQNLAGSSKKLSTYFYLRAKKMGIKKEIVKERLKSELKLEDLRDLKRFVRGSLESFSIPRSHKQFLLDIHYSPLLNNKKLQNLWKRKKIKEAKDWLKSKPKDWLVKGPFYYT